MVPLSVILILSLITTLFIAVAHYIGARQGARKAVAYTTESLRRALPEEAFNMIMAILAGKLETGDVGLITVAVPNNKNVDDVVSDVSSFLKEKEKDVEGNEAFKVL